MSNHITTLNLINSKTSLHVKSKTNNQTNEKELYTFNKLNQLTSYTKQDKKDNPIITLNYTYDGLNRRIKKEQIKTNQETNQATTTITKYLYDQNSNIIALLDENNNLKATIIHNDSIDTPLAIINHKTNKTYYYNKNHLNTILFLTDDNQNIVEEFTYKNAYGEIKEHTINEQTLNPYSYTSRENDTDTLYYYRARYYDSTLKTFISEDPIRYNSGDFNWYRYVSNSPVMYGDAWGLATGKWLTSPTITKGGFRFDSLELIRPYLSNWGYINFIRIHGNVFGKIFASVECTDQDDCFNDILWTKNINMDIIYNGSFDIGPNIVASIVGLRFGFKGWLTANIGIILAKSSYSIYKLHSKWGAKAKKAYDALIERGPSALCNIGM